MSERPILFSGPMVRAILDGSKTQTRRVVKPQPERMEKYEPGHPWAHASDPATWSWDNGAVSYQSNDRRCPYGAPGDRLWVRETWALVPTTAYRASVGVEQRINPAQPADAAIYREGFDRSSGGIRWRPSIHMPRWASRITLAITDVRVERLQDISVADAIAEGCPGGERGDRYAAVEQYRMLWDSLNAARGFGWNANQWVWVVTFMREGACP